MAGMLLLGASSALSAPTGNVNLGLAGINYFSNVFPFINILKSAASILITNSNAPGITYDSAVPQGATNVFGSLSPFGSGLYLDGNGDLLSSLPAGTIQFSRLVYSVTGGGPPNYASPGAAMTVDWTGGGAGWTVSVTYSSGTLASGTGSTPLTFTWPTGSTQVNFVITGSGASPPTQPRMYKTAYAPQLAAGKHLEPEYVSSTSPAAWSIRFMDWMNTNINTTSTSISNMPALANGGWAAGGGGFGAVNSNTTGVPLDIIISAARDLNKNPWICIPEGFTTPKMSTLYSISSSTTPVVKTYGPHNFSNGDTVIFSRWQPFSGPRLTNPASYSASTFNVSGVNVLKNNTPITFGMLEDGTLDSSTYPTGITKASLSPTTVPIYWTVNATSTTFQIAATVGGAPLSLSGSMTGTINVLQNAASTGTFGRLVIATSYASSTWTLNSHALANGTPIQFGISPTAPLNPGWDGNPFYPTGLPLLTTVFVVNATTNTFQTSLTPGGAAMTLSGSMTGQINIWLTLSGNSFTVANVNAANNTFEITGPGADTSGYVGASKVVNAFAVGGVNAGVVLQPYSLSTITSRVGALVNYVVANLPTNLTGIWELGNEIWNNQFSAYYNLLSQVTNSTLFQNSVNFANGYFQAAVAHAVRTAYGTGNRSKYKFVLSGNQTTADLLGSSNGVAAGALQYITDNASGLTITDLFDFLSMTTYTGALSYGPNGVPVTATFGTNTVAFSSPGGNILPPLGAPIKLNTNSPGGTLPSGLSAGVLGGTSYPSGSGTIYWLVGSGPNFGLATSPGGTPLTFSGGSGSNSAVTCSVDVIQYLMTQSTSLHGSNPATYPNQWTYFDTSIGEDTYNAKWTGGAIPLGGFTGSPVTYLIGRCNYFINNYTAAGKPLAGLPLIAYEGGESNVPISPLGGFPLLNDATWRAAYTFQQYGAGSAANFMQVHTGAVQTGLLSHQAQFVDVTVLEITFDRGDFGARQYIGDDNARWLGIVAVNALN